LQKCCRVKKKRKKMPEKCQNNLSAEVRGWTEESISLPARQRRKRAECQLDFFVKKLVTDFPLTDERYLSGGQGLSVEFF
jgi:hypothetical protein